MPTLIMAYPIPTVPYVPVNYSCFSVKFVPRMPPRNDSTRRVPASSRNRKKKSKYSERGRLQLELNAFSGLKKHHRIHLMCFISLVGLWLGRVV